MNKFTKGRSSIFKESRQEKRRLLEQFDHDRKEYLRKLERGDKETAQHFKIGQSQRHTKPGLEEREQQRLLHRSVGLVKKEMREEERKALREIEKQRDLKVKNMRDQLLDNLYSTAA